MFCKNCGTELPEGTVFCANCGAEQKEAAQPVYAEPVVNNAALNSTPILTMGILAMVFCEFGILGIIFGAIGKKKAKNYAAQGGTLTGKAKVGKILSTVGLIVGIIMTVVWVIYAIGIGALISSGLY